MAHQKCHHLQSNGNFTKSCITQYKKNVQLDNIVTPAINYEQNERAGGLLDSVMAEVELMTLCSILLLIC